MYEKVLKASDIVWFLRRQWSQLRKQKDARKAHGNTQCEHLVTCKYQSVKWNRGYLCQSKWNSETRIYSVYEKVLKASDIVWFLRRQWSQLRKQKDARKAHGNTQCEHLVTCKYQSVKWNRGYVCQSKWNRG